jgi:hypothetical protein
MKKQFRFIIKSIDNIILVEEVVTFNSKENALPNALLRYKDDFLYNNFKVEVSEDLNYELNDQNGLYSYQDLKKAFENKDYQSFDEFFVNEIKRG